MIASSHRVCDADATLTTYLGRHRRSANAKSRYTRGDNLLTIQAFLAQGYEGQVQLIYIDPPFNSDEKYNYKTVLNLKCAGKFERNISVIESMAHKGG